MEIYNRITGEGAGYRAIAVFSGVKAGDGRFEADAPGEESIRECLWSIDEFVNER